MTLLIAGDIGGTNTVLGLVEAKTWDGLHKLYEARYPSQEYPDLVPIIKQFLGEAAKKLGYEPIPQRACFAIAGPVINNTSILTNLGWSLGSQRLEEALGISPVILINDFAAVGYGVLALDPADLHTLQTGQHQANAPIAVIGAGTGLGEGFLIQQGESYQIFATEGGHTDFAPRNKLEFELLQYLRDKYQIDRVSVERVVSGQGIVAIYQFLRDRQVDNEESAIAGVVRQWEKEVGRTEKTVDPAAAISKAALEKSDSLSEQTMQIFVDAYGAEAGNLALKLLPYGGLYIAGGIAGKNLSLIAEGSFMQSFSHKGRVSPLLERVPVHVVRNPQVGLLGAAVCAARL